MKTAKNESERRLTPSEAARELGLSVTRVRQLVDARVLEGERTPLGRLIAAEAVACYRAMKRGRP